MKLHRIGLVRIYVKQVKYDMSYARLLGKVLKKQNLIMSKSRGENSLIAHICLN